MKTFVLLALIVFLNIVNARPEETYSTKYDNVNVDDILRSDRLLKNYANCLLDRGSCGPDAKLLRSLISDGLATDCVKCSEVQKEKGKHVVNYLMNNKPDLWKQLEEKYDPDQKYRTEHEKELLAIQQAKADELSELGH